MYLTDALPMSFTSTLIVPWLAKENGHVWRLAYTYKYLGHLIISCEGTIAWAIDLLVLLEKWND